MNAPFKDCRLCGKVHPHGHVCDDFVGLSNKEIACRDWGERNVGSEMKSMQFTDDYDVAEQQHGAERDEFISRAGVFTSGRWNIPAEHESEIRLLLRLAWESGWDSALAKVK